MNSNEIVHNQILKDIKVGKKVSPLRAIRLFCLACNGFIGEEVKTCGSEECILHAFRFGKNTTIKKRKFTEEQKKKLRERLSENRK